MARKVGCKPGEKRIGGRCVSAKGVKVYALLEEYRGVPEGLWLFTTEKKMNDEYREQKRVADLDIELHRYYNVLIK